MAQSVTAPVTNAPSVWDSVKETGSKVANWMGRTFSDLTNALSSLASKVAESVKPVFAAIYDFVAKYAAIAKTWIVEHKEISIGAGVALAILAFGLFAYKVMNCEDPEQQKNPSSST